MPDFRAHAELSAIGELGGGIPHCNGAGCTGQKMFSRPGIAGDNTVGVVGTMTADMRQGIVHVIDQAC